MSTIGQKRLGRGLDALLTPTTKKTPDLQAAGTQEERAFRDVAVASVSPNPGQPRKEFSEAELAELRASIKANGLLQPIIVRPRGDRYEIVAGERRFRAVRDLGWKTVPAHVRELSDQDVLTLALIENLQRMDLNPIEEAEGYQELMARHTLTQQQVADAVGRDRSTVANVMRLLGLPDRVRTMVRDGSLTVGHARALLGISDPVALATYAEVVVRDGLPVRAVELHIRHRAKAGDKPARPKSPRASSRPAELTAVEARLRKRFQTDASITLTGPHRGDVRLSFYSTDDFERLLELLSVSEME